MSRNRLLSNYGWVQNTSNLSTVRDTVDLVPEEGIRHLDLREAIRIFRENNNDLPNRWTWDARCRIKAIHATGMVKINRNIQGYELTELGKRLKQTIKGNAFHKGFRILVDEEKNIFREGLLTNPPVIKVLQLLYDDYRKNDRGLTKYDVGRELGFIGDIGFTHIDPYWVVNNGYSINDKEGDADKWARTILSWLTQVGWADNTGIFVINDVRIKTYKATKEVGNVIRYAFNRIERNVPIEMLCSDHHQFPKLIQNRRATILKNLSNKPKTIKNLVTILNESGIEVSANTIEFEIINLKNAGFRIQENGGYIKLIDRIILDMPTVVETSSETIDEIENLIEENVVKYENTLPPRFVDSLIRYGYNGDRSNEFESIVAEYFRYLGFRTDYLGQGHGRVPDVLAKFFHPSVYARSYAIIIDAKATSGKYNFPAADKRKMKEYINTRGPILMQENIPNHSFSFISSEFIENVEPHLTEIIQETSIGGCAIRALDLLEIGDKIKTQKINISEMYTVFTSNTLVAFSSINCTN